MKRLLLLSTILLAACADAETPAAEPATSVEAPTDAFLDQVIEANPATLAQVADTVWVHTTNYNLPSRNPISSNGMAVLDGDDIILVDGAWGELATVALIKQVEAELGGTVSRMIVTHHHPDRTGGVDAAELMGIEIIAHPRTAALAFESGFPVPDTSVASLAEQGNRTRVGPVEVAFPGEAHAADNLVVYVPSANILYGGCAVRGAEVTTMGNTVDASMDQWADTMRWLKATYPETALVVPGHGKGGDLTLLDQTIALVEAENG